MRYFQDKGKRKKMECLKKTRREQGRINNQRKETDMDEVASAAKKEH